MDLHLNDKIVLITGGSKGLGRAMAQRFASEGCLLHLVARTQETLDEAANALRRQYPIKVDTLAIDLAQHGAAERVAKTCGDVDILVNNAGDVPSGSLEAIEEDRWRAGWDTKVFNYINLSREYFRRMTARGSGVIVNLTGIGGDLLDPSYIAGGVGNAAMAAFTKSLGSNSHKVGVRVVGVNPGACATERYERLARAKAQERYGDPDRWQEALGTLPFGRPATPDEIAAAVVFLAFPLSGYTTGAILTIDGGVTGGREITR
jgi:NAD(P)-dependent dehydrogenase (short-subunit alcohol dehydrogenase family)